jgi:hypothetical protein
LKNQNPKFRSFLNLLYCKIEEIIPVVDATEEYDLKWRTKNAKTPTTFLSRYDIP